MRVWFGLVSDCLWCWWWDVAWGINVLYVYRINIHIIPTGISHINRYSPVVQVRPSGPFQDPVG